MPTPDKAKFFSFTASATLMPPAMLASYVACAISSPTGMVSTPVSTSPCIAKDAQSSLVISCPETIFAPTQAAFSFTAKSGLPENVNKREAITLNGPRPSIICSMLLGSGGFSTHIIE